MFSTTLDISCVVAELCPTMPNPLPFYFALLKRPISCDVEPGSMKTRFCSVIKVWLFLRGS